MESLKQFLISPPFGNWITTESSTSILGSFTWEARPGLVYHILRSFRRVKGGWINQIGLRNKGIRSVTFQPNKIYSLVGLDHGDWERMLDYCPPGITVEVNLGCPNVHEYGIPPAVLRDYCEKFNVIAKLPPVIIENIPISLVSGFRREAPPDEMAAMCIEAGAKLLHCSNTLPTPHGGISGRRLFMINLPIVGRLAMKYPGQIIAGGGIYGRDMVTAYRIVGASYFSLSTVCLTPWRIKQITKSF